MDWQELSEYLNQSYDFLGRIQTSNFSKQYRVPIHPLLRMSACLTLKAISNNNQNRLVVLLPKRLNCAKWIASLCTFEIMRRDYLAINTLIAQLSVGQKLIVNRCIAEYLGEEFIPRLNSYVIKVKCSDGIYGITLDRKLVFQAASTDRPLSPIIKISRACKSAQNINNSIDNILGIRTMGNRSMFQSNVILISRIRETEHFAGENHINEISIIDLFLWGKLNLEGDVSVIKSQQIQSNPCCLISPDLYSALNYINRNPGTNKGVIIDGTAYYLNNLQVLDEMLDQKIPVVVICDLLEIKDLSLLTERNFRIWQWNRENIKQSRTLVETQWSSPFSALNYSIFHYCNQKINTTLCEYPELSTVVEKTIKLKSFIQSDQQQISFAYFKLIKLINSFCRLVRIPDQTWSEIFYQKFQLLKKEFESQWTWLSDRAIECMEIIFNVFSDVVEKPLRGQNHKVKNLNDIISNSPESDILDIIVANTEEKESSLSFWKPLLSGKKINNIRFMTVPDLLCSYGSSFPTKIVVCGWLGGNMMYPLLHSFITSETTILVYPFEQEWFSSVQKKWDAQNNFSIYSKDFSEMLGKTEKELELIEHKADGLAEPIEKEEFDFFEFDLKLRTYRYRNYVSSQSSQEEVCIAKLVVFSCNRFAFITESHRLPVVTDLMRGEVSENEIPRKPVDQLRPGDYVMFQESNRDIIREIADKGLTEAGQSHLRKLAALWKDALREIYSKMAGDADRVVELLRRAGCKRHPVTIKNWLVNEDQIGPGISADLQIIAEATGNEQLHNRFNEVRDAILIVRSAHIQASSFIRNKLLANLPEIVEVERGLPDYAGESIQLNLDEFGQMIILRIEEIGDNWEEIPANHVNYLLSEEE